jgi:very-short-patch-repair endonuclease
MIRPGMRDRARDLRQRATTFEQSLWRAVRSGRFAGYKFRRQQVLGPYIADFVCQQLRVVVELDGGQHAESQGYDAARDTWLKAEGYRVLRVWNNEWLGQREAVLERLWFMLQGCSPHPRPLSPEGRGEQGDSLPLP